MLSSPQRHKHAKTHNRIVKSFGNTAALCAIALLLSGCSVPRLSMPDFSLPTFGLFDGDENDGNNTGNNNNRTQNQNTENAQGDAGREIQPTDPRDIARPSGEEDAFSVQRPDILTRPPGADQTPNNQVSPESAQPNTDFDFRSLGMNAEPLFMRPVNSPEERFRRLEQAVQGIRTDLNNMAPSLARLISVEEDLQLLIGELQILLEEEAEPEPTEFLIPSAPAPLSTVRGTPRQPVQTLDRQRQRTPSPMLSENEQRGQQNRSRNAQFTRLGEDNAAAAQPQAREVPLTRPTPENAQTQAQAPQRNTSRSNTQSSFNTPQVTDIRVGEYNDKMRIVFDLSSRAEFEFDFDAFENIFSLMLPEADIAPSARINRLGGSLIRGATASPYGDGQMIAIDLMGNTDLINNGAIEPTDGNRNFRLFFDFAK